MALSSILVGLCIFLCTTEGRRYGHQGHPGRPEHHRHPERHLNRPSFSRNVCYAGIGCFSSDYPFNNTGEVPQDPTFVNTVFKLFTRQHPTVPHILQQGRRGSLLQSTFDSSHPVKILIHGFLATSNAYWIGNQTRAFLRREPTNVIAVEWGQGAGFPYVQAAANTRLVGAEVATLAMFLSHETGTSYDSYHLIGHSLGAHVCGYAGRILPSVGRITGLDPAEPNFQNEAPIVRLDPTDAQFVDVIHTDGSPFDTLGGFGMIRPVGHLDFYPNGGVQQPGCARDGWSSFMSSAYSSGVEVAEFTVGCNHNRASHLFTESINSDCPFTAYPCDSYEDFQAGNCFTCGGSACPSMGYSAQRPHTPGSYYLLTNPSSPFCGYHYKVELQLGSQMRRLRGVIKVRLHGNRKQTQVIELHRGIINPGSLITKVFVSADDVINVEDVNVTFEIVYGFMDYLGFWSTGSNLHVQRLTTLSVNNNDRKVFCTSQGMLASGRGLWMTDGATSDTC